jgi:hypothetical protein
MAYIIEKYPLPVFHSVQCLQLTTYSLQFAEYILSLFVNIKSLYIIIEDIFEDLFETILNILLRKQFKQLQQFYWGDHIVVEFFGEEAVITKFNLGRISVHSAKIQEP